MFKKTSTLFLISALVLLFSSCEKNDEAAKVVYKITDNQSGFTVKYRNSEGELLSEQVTPTSKEDEWKHSFNSKEGEIVYVSAIYDDINTGIKVQILLDGKVYKQASSLYDTLNFVTLSGSIPYK